MNVSDSGNRTHPEPDPEHNYWPGGADEVLGVLANGVKVKRRMLRMRACTEKDAKGKLCRGHIKRYFEIPEEVRVRFHEHEHAYRCERCKTIYLPNPSEAPRTQTMVW